MNDSSDRDQAGPTVSVELTLMSGETISVQDAVDEELTEAALRRYAERLVRELQTDTVHTFAYWWNGEFYVDAVRMREVAAFSVSPADNEEDDVEEEWEAP